VAELWDVERLPAASVQAIYRAKVVAWAAALLVLLALRRLVNPALPVLGFSLVTLPAWLPTLVVAAWPGAVPRAVLAGTVIADILGVTAAIRLGGGVEVIGAPMLYVVIVGLAGLLLSGMWALGAATVSAGAYAGLVWAMEAGYLARAAFTRPAARQVAAVGNVTIALFLSAWLVLYAARRVREVYRGAERLREDGLRALSHDLRAPLGIIHGYAQMAAEATGSALRGYLERIRHCALQALDLVQNVLDVATVGVRPIAPRYGPVDANALATELVDLHRLPAVAKGIALSAAEAPQSLIVPGDAQLLERAVSNLISNAIKYTPAGGRVEVAVQSEASAVSWVVTDSGQGMTAAEQARLFQPFSRISTSFGTEGVGLGLYIVRRIAEAHGGTVQVASEIGRGSRFTIRLPRVAQPRADLSRQAAPGARLPDDAVRAIYLAKAVAYAILIAIAWPAKVLYAPAAPVPSVILILLAMVLPAAVVARWPDRVLLMWVSLATDIVGATAAIHAGGGVEMVAGPMAYLVFVGLAGLTLSGRAGFVAAAGSVAAYGCVVWAEQQGKLPHRVFSFLRPVPRQASAVVLVGACLFVGAAFLAYAMRQIRAVYRRADELRSELAGTLSHDLKTPLTVIDRAAELVAGAEARERTELLHGIERAAQRAIDLVRNVLDAAAIDGRGVMVQPQPVRFNDLVREVTGLYRLAAEARQVHLDVGLGAGVGEAAVDPQLVSRAIGNLVANAIRHTAPGGTVRVTTDLRGGALTLAVRDTGCGIAPAEQGKLFQKYGRVTSPTAGEGTGLGLYIVRRVAEAHGGTVRVRSALGTGSEFTVELPVAEA
jgi:signal transduction histidine kinase